MCGRARCTLRADDVTRACYRSRAPVRTVNMDRYRARYNAAPGADFPVIRRGDGADGEDGVVLQCMKWGLIPSFTKKSEKPDYYRMFNARSESICEKASFRRLIPKSRCVVAVEGFYEWKKDGSKKQPYYVHFKDGRPLVFAALYDSWENSEGEKLYTFTIITTSSSSALGWLHDRMPVILGDKESVDAWLDGSSASNFDKLLKPYEGHDLVWYPVTPAMGKVSFDGPECSNEIQLKTESTNSITKFFSTKGTKKAEIIPKDTSLHNSSVRTDIIESVKEEPATKGERTQTSSTVKIEEPETKEERAQPSSTVKCEEESETKEETAQPSAGKCEEEPETEERVKCEEPETEERVKCEELETEERWQPSSTVKCKEDVKGMVSQLSQEYASKGKTKRNYDELLVNSKPVLKEADKKYGGSPAKKKVNLKASHDKQPTLFSYFGKS